MYDELVKRLRERCVFLFPHHGESRSYMGGFVTHWAELPTIIPAEEGE